MIAVHTTLPSCVLHLMVLFAHKHVCVFGDKKKHPREILAVGFVTLLSSILQADYLQEASMLMAKLCYVEGEYRDALGNSNYCAFVYLGIFSICFWLLIVCITYECAHSFIDS